MVQKVVLELDEESAQRIRQRVQELVDEQEPILNQLGERFAEVERSAEAAIERVKELAELMEKLGFERVEDGDGEA